MQRHLWFGDGFVMVGFRSGRVVVVSSLRCVGVDRQPFTVGSLCGVYRQRARVHKQPLRVGSSCHQDGLV